MQGIILAAGFGKRLKPFTDNKPKALVEINGKPFLFHIIKKFVSAGINDIYINTYYHSKQIIDYIKSMEKEAPFDKNVKFTAIVEKDILGTGGGIKNISENYFTNNGSISNPFFIVYNVDVICDVNILDVIDFHKNNSAFVTMVMQKRKSKNPIIVDSINNHIIGRYKNNYQLEGNNILLAFCGIQVINYEVNNQYSNTGFFSIIDTYLGLIEKQKKILSYKLKDNIYWKDVGTIEDLKEAEQRY